MNEEQQQRICARIGENSSVDFRPLCKTLTQLQHLVPNPPAYNYIYDHRPSEYPGVDERVDMCDQFILDMFYTAETEIKNRGTGYIYYVDNQEIIYPCVSDMIGYMIETFMTTPSTQFEFKRILSHEMDTSSMTPHELHAHFCLAILDVLEWEGIYRDYPVPPPPY